MKLKFVQRIVLLTAILTLFAVTPSFAAQRYASPTATAGPASCPENDPCSIVNAMNPTFTNNGDEVILAPGDYNIGTAELDITDGIDVHGTGIPSATRILGSGNVQVWMGNAGATLRNVEINQSAGIVSALYIDSGTAANIVANSSSSSGCQVSNALIRDSICTSSDSGSAGVFINQSGGTHSSILRNVTGIGNGSSNSYGLYAGASSGGTVTFDVKSSVFVGTTNDISASGNSATSIVTLSHSNFDNVFEVSATVTDEGTNNNQTDEPIFVNAAGGNFHQATNSPTIDQGIVDGSSGSIDIDGQPRTIGSAPDMGADEIDNVAPGIPTFTAPATGTMTTDQTVLVSGNAEADSTVAVLDGPTQVCTATATGGAFTCTTSVLAEGSHSLRATATDAAGNESFISNSITVIIDLTAPQTKISKKPKSKTTKRKAKFTFTSSEPNSTFRCKLDKGAFKACKSTYQKSVRPGKHKLQVIAIDALGNADASPASYKWKVLRP